MFWIECSIYKIFCCKTEDQLFIITIYGFNYLLITWLPSIFEKEIFLAFWRVQLKGKSFLSLQKNSESNDLFRNSRSRKQQNLSKSNTTSITHIIIIINITICIATVNVIFMPSLFFPENCQLCHKSRIQHKSNKVKTIFNSNIW